MKRPAVLSWPTPERKPLAHPYRDTLIVYAVLALVVLLISALTGGNIVRALVIASLFFVIASAWSLAAVRRRLRQPPESGG